MQVLVVPGSASHDCSNTLSLLFLLVLGNSPPDTTSKLIFRFRRPFAWLRLGSSHPLPRKGCECLCQCPKSLKRHSHLGGEVM
ncbi:hypothetical protein HDV63DRAFT_249086 [Trichoderma sp. SZMC 28014]